MSELTVIGRRLRPCAAGLLAVLLGTTACGARWTDEQKAAVVAGGDQIRVEEVAQDPSRSSVTSATVAGRSGGAAVDGGGGAAAGPVQDGGVAAGPADGDGGPVAPDAALGPLPCAAPSDAPGVTDDKLTIGTISTITGPVPGYGAAAAAAVRAYAAYRNSTGGVCGRELVVRVADDGADNGRYQALAKQLDSEALAFVGGYAAGDAGGAEFVERAQIPVVATTMSKTVFNPVTSVFDINPKYADPGRPIGKFGYLHDQGVRTAAIVYVAQELARAEALVQKSQMQASGIEVVHEKEIPLSTLSFDSAARGVANSKADYMFFLYDSGSSASMARSLADTDYRLKFAEYLSGYGSQFIEQAGTAGEGAVSWIRTVPNEDPTPIPIQAAFLEWMPRVAPNDVIDTSAADSWAAAIAFAQALESLSGPITREALLAQFRSMETFDADGFLGPIKLGPKQNNGCLIAMQVREGRWARLTPAQGFLCG